MRKILTFCGLFWLLFVTWCNKNILDHVELQEWELLYNDILTVAGVGPVISMEPTVDDWTLVLIWKYEDHTDHVFLQSGTRESHFNTESEYLPWNKLHFKGMISELDWAAGNHYYTVNKINSLSLKSYPETTDIKNIMNSYNFCETDNDCSLIVWECPFGCRITVNKNYKNVIWDIIYNYFENIQWEKCVYRCMYAEKVICNNNKCDIDTNLQQYDRKN